MVDLFLTIGAAPLWFPILCIVALVVRFKLGTPIFFRQVRPGKDGKPFEMIKFRSMTDARDAQGVLLTDADRLSRFGKLLRATSLDELPELWNVLKGEMSLVGPRPLLMEYLAFYSAEEARRHDVPPGITGWAQVNGRNGISWEEKFALDVWYVEHQSVWLDLKIIFITLLKVLKKDGISSEGSVTAERFRR
jgi:lipopolysaccharide/colanic/teichoic acid biosynthesis glycosyltransferase